MALLSPCVVLYLAVGGANVTLPGSNRCFDCGLLPQLRPLFGLCVGPGFVFASPLQMPDPFGWLSLQAIYYYLVYLEKFRFLFFFNFDGSTRLDIAPVL